MGSITVPEIDRLFFLFLKIAVKHAAASFIVTNTSVQEHMRPRVLCDRMFHRKFLEKQKQSVLFIHRIK